ADDLGRLHRRVAENFVKNQGDINNDIMKVKTLMYAHLLREEAPESLQEDMMVVLERVHHLLNGLLNICMEQRFVTATMNVIECSQLFTQARHLCAMWFHSNHLLQLPHFDQQCIKMVNKGISASKHAGGAIDKAPYPPTVGCQVVGHAILMLTHEPSLLPGPQIKEIGGEQRRKLLPNLSDEQHLDIDLFLSHFPDVEITFEAHVEDENDEGDVINLEVKVERKHLPEDSTWADSDEEDADPDDSIFDEQLKDYEEGSEAYEEKKEELMDAWRDAYFERQKKKREREKQPHTTPYLPPLRFFASCSQAGELGFAAKPLRDPVPVHAPLFPFDRYEQWMVLLVDQKTNRLIGYQKLSQNTRFEKIQLKFLAPKEGTVQYEIHCLCSAYMGADKKVLMKKTINKKEEKEEKTAAEVAEDEDDDEEEEEEPEGKWYYMGGNSVGELILNIIALAVAGVMLFNFLYAKGWWQKFCQPLLDWLLNISWPFLSFVGLKLEPGWLWFSANVYDFNHFAFMFENLTAANTSNASISTKVRFNDTSFLNQDPYKQNLFNDPLNENLHDD
ncbi:MAG: hypothetical protein SGPRY_012536, partial [Prymnesium sp.]